MRTQRASTPAPTQIGLEHHPVIRGEAQARYLQDEVQRFEAARAARRVVRPWDERHAIRLAGQLLRLYLSMSRFVKSHLCGWISGRDRELRLMHCRGCSMAQDRGDGILFCTETQKICSCPKWFFSGIWYRTWLANAVCPLDYWDRADAARAPDTVPAPPNPA